MSDHAAAAEHIRFTIRLPRRIVLKFAAGHYGHKGIKPMWWIAQRGGRAAMSKNPIDAIKILLAWEKVKVRPL